MGCFPNRNNKKDLLIEPIPSNQLEKFSLKKGFYTKTSMNNCFLYSQLQKSKQRMMLIFPLLI